MKCPKNCNGSGPDRQGKLTDGQRALIPEEVASKAEYRCSYCGCVYDFQGVAYGLLNNGILGEGWHLSRHPLSN